MNYEDFIKSKHIAERWGEAQASFESSEENDTVAYYHQLLTEFYDYIQYLEAKNFGAEPAQDTLSELTESPAPYTPAPMTPPVSFPAAEIATDEEDPWFGFD